MKTLGILLLLLTIGIESLAQDEINYFKSDNSPVENEQNAVYKQVIQKKNKKKIEAITYKLEDKTWTKIKIEKIKYLSDSIIQIKRSGDRIWKELISRVYYKTSAGLYTFRDYKGGELILEGKASSLVPLIKEDTVKAYYPSGKLKTIALYKNNALQSNQNWLQNGSKYYSNIHYFVDQIPEYSMGPVNFRAHILKGIKESGIDLGQISDRVVIGWVVMEDGSLVGFHKTSGVYAPLNSLLIELIKDMPGEWVPASLQGKAVRFYMTIPFNFIDKSESFEQLEFNTGFVVWD